MISGGFSGIPTSKRENQRYVKNRYSAKQQEKEKIAILRNVRGKFLRFLETNFSPFKPSIKKVGTLFLVTSHRKEKCFSSFLKACS
jgi:hypothetical protein